MKHTVTIRMGAAHWDATVSGHHYDFRKMTTDQRKGWYGKFMGSIRRFFRGGDQPQKAAAPHRRHRRPSRPQKAVA